MDYSDTVPSRKDEAPPRASRRQHLFSLARAAKGFMPDGEGEALYLAALRAGASFELATFVEIGAWCGKSTVYLGAAAEETDAVLFSLDHHRGSEENQVGWEHHDPSLVDRHSGRIDTLPHWRATIGEAGLEPAVVGIVGSSSTVSARWSTPAGLVLHRRRSRRATGMDGLPGVGTEGGGEGLARHPRRLSRSSRRRSTPL